MSFALSQSLPAAAVGQRQPPRIGVYVEGPHADTMRNP
jgi:hypothetical protein